MHKLYSMVMSLPMTADDGHYPGPDVGNIIATVLTVALVAFVACAIAYLAVAVS